MSHNEKRSLIIIGNGMTSLRLCQNLVERKLNETFKIILFGEELFPAYDRVHLTDFIQSQDNETIRLCKEGWYKDNNIDLRTGLTISRINPAQRTIVDLNGNTYPYHTLIFATGSKAFVPPIAGVKSTGVFVYRTIKDANTIKSFSKNKENAITIGGGLLGLEAANALRQIGLSTTIVEHSNGLMSRQLDQQASTTLQQKILQKDLSVRLKKELIEILQFGDGLLLKFSDSSELKTDMVVIAAGVRPRDELAQEAGLTCGARGGIVVNDELQTSNPHIFAIGECAMHRGQTYGFIAPCYQMADVLAARLDQKTDIYQGSDRSCRLKLIGIEVSALGDYLDAGRRIAYQGDGVYRMINLRSDRIVGATYVGEWDQAPHLQLAVNENRFMSPIEQSSFRDTGRIEEVDTIQNWPSTATICNCMQITKGQISACMEGGCKTIDSLSQATGAGTVCGSCRPLLAQLTGTGGEAALYRPKGKSLMLTAAAIGISLCVAMLLFTPLPTAESVQTTYYEVTKIWNDSLYKQISGYTMAGLSALALLLSARKRISWFNKINFGWWRAVHSLLGTLCLIALVLHTGLDFGENLNSWLMTCFLGLNTAGAFAGFTLAMEQKWNGRIARRLRSIVIKSHIAFFWPYPALLGFHIYKIYAY